MITIKMKRLVENAVLPKKAHKTDAGFDMVATNVVYDPDGCATYGTGIAMEIPEGYVGLIFPRSSICRKDLTLANCVGVIDSGYRGEVSFKFKPTLMFSDRDVVGTSVHDRQGTFQTDIATQFVTAAGRHEDMPDVPDGCSPISPAVYEVGDRIGQLIIIKLPDVDIVESADLANSDRGIGGYGSTGK